MDSCPDTGIDPNLLYETALAYISSTNWMFIFALHAVRQERL